MKFFVREVNQSNDLKMTAGIKARDDMEEILMSQDILPLNIKLNSQHSNLERENVNTIKKLNYHKKVYEIWKEKLSDLQSGDILFVQFPIIEHSIFLHKCFKYLTKHNIKIVLIIQYVIQLTNPSLPFSITF